MKPTKSTKPLTTGPATASAILGTSNKSPKSQTPPAPDCCFVCRSKLTGARIGALRGLGTPVAEWMCVKCSTSVTTPRLGIFMGEVGTSELLIVDKIYTDSVRDIFMEGPGTKEEED